MTTGPNVLLDTSAVIDFEEIDGRKVAERAGCAYGDLAPGISAITLAELATGPHATAEARERAARQARLQWVEATFDPLPFDSDAARTYGLIYNSVLTVRRAQTPQAPGRSPHRSGCLRPRAPHRHPESS